MDDTEMHERMTRLETAFDAYKETDTERHNGIERRLSQCEQFRVRREDWITMSKAVEDLKNFKMKILFLVSVASLIGSAIGAEGVRTIARAVSGH